MASKTVNTASVCHVTSVHPWDDIRIFKKEVISTAKHAHKTYLVAPNAPSQFISQVEVIGVELPLDMSRLKRVFYQKKKIIEKAIQLDADIYHLHDPELISYVKKLNKLGKKVIYDSHEDVPKAILSKNWLKPAFIRTIISKIYNLYEKRVCKHCAGVISVLPEITQKFTNKNLETIYNYPIIKDEVKVKNSSLTRLIYVGGLTRIRGIKEICESLNYLDDTYELMLVGKWESDYFRNECLDIVKNKTQLIDKGLVDFETCQEFLKSGDIGLAMLHKVPNYMNSLPIKAYEYAINQLPTLMSDIPYWQKEFENFAVFTDPMNPEGIAEKVIEINSNYESHVQKVISYRENVISDKNWANEETKLINFYNKVLTN